MKYQIRKLLPNEYPILEEFLYSAIFQKDENNLIPKEIIYTEPTLQIFYKDFGMKNDFCLVVEYEKEIIGAAWVRLLNGVPKGFGNIDDTTPELAISINPNFRSKGIGKVLLKELLVSLKENNYTQISLAVQKENYALKLYQEVGFKIIKEVDEEYIMLCLL
ncbi:MAG: GNAT family N-acetyltransferase [Coprobacillaceae bacterium]